MKKLQNLSLSLLVLVAFLLSACMKHAETVGDGIQRGELKEETKIDALAETVEALLQNNELLEELNDLDLAEQPPLEAFLDACDSKHVREIYTERNFKNIFIRPAKDRSAEAMNEIAKIAQHGSNFELHNAERLELLMQEHLEDKPLPPFEWQEGDAATLTEVLRKLGYSHEGIALDANNLEAQLKGQKCEHILPRYCEFVRQTQVEMEKTAKRFAEQDVLLSCELLRWAQTLRLKYPENNYAFDRFRPYVSDEAIYDIRSRVFLRDMAKRGPKAALSSITPKHPQYAKLMQARELYIKAIEAGGWPDVKNQSTSRNAKTGKAYAFVPSLRARLKAEGYAAGADDSDILDDELVKAIEIYRDVHQLSPKRLIDPVLFRNLAVGPKNRLESIDLTLQRYREIAIGSLQYYLKINVPDFHAELWDGEQRLMRIRIVVGNDDMQRDLETGQFLPDEETQLPIHPNRTPLQTSKINEIILNPYWNVPARIRIEELEPKLAENPNYYLENNYEEVNVDDPRLYYVRELPNPKNSLGIVKFMFPNPFNTYLHDTPHKGIFRNPVRGNSHGCMRMQNPLDFAQTLLERDGQWDPQYVDDILGADEPVQTSIFLKNPVDVDVVYLNTRVDDSGVVAFLSDLYKYDAVRLGKHVVKKLPKIKPKPKPEPEPEPEPEKSLWQNIFSTP